MKRNENKKSNKKVLTVAALALLLGFVGYTGGSTYAKYVTSATTGSQVATVAQWGYVVTADATNLFGASYESTGGAVQASRTESGLAVSADTTGETQIVAPGTHGSMKISINGQPEVKSKIEITDTLTQEIVLLTTDGTNAVNYKPVEWTLTVTKATVGGVDNKLTTVPSTKNFQEIVDELAELGNASIPANTLTDVELELSWQWAFTTNATNDGYDTMLGDLAALSETALKAKYGETTVPTGKLSFSWTLGINIEQIQ